MAEREDRLPVRQATRILNEFQLSSTAVAVAAVGRNLDRATVFLALLRVALRAPDDRTLSANAIATSLKRPIETIRRHMQHMVALGLCRRADGRYVLADDFLEQPRVIAAQAELLLLFQALLAAAMWSGLSLPPAAANQPLAILLVGALDIFLGIYELAEARLPNSTDLYVIGAIAVFNAAAITNDAGLSRRYGFADTVPPDALRRPVSVRQIADCAGLSYATIWRHVAQLAAAGAIVPADGGYLLATRFMDDAQTSRRSRERLDHFLLVVRRSTAPR